MVVQGQWVGGRAPGAPSSREDLIVLVHALGTAIVRDGEPTEEPPGLKIMPVRRLDNNRRNAR
jgi:hypothetical protein